MNYGEIVLLVISGWALVSVAVAATVGGGIARAHRVKDPSPLPRPSRAVQPDDRSLAS